jgi:hypothetical protein
VTVVAGKIKVLDRMKGNSRMCVWEVLSEQGQGRDVLYVVYFIAYWQTAHQSRHDHTGAREPPCRLQAAWPVVYHPPWYLHVLRPPLVPQVLPRMLHGPHLPNGDIDTDSLQARCDVGGCTRGEHQGSCSKHHPW